MTIAIEASGLTKSFGATRAVEALDLEIRRGSVYGLLGPNGAGKTTTIRILATLLRPDSGTASVLGHDVVRHAAAVRQKVNLTGQYASVDEDLTGQENLILIGRLIGLSWRRAKERAIELLEAFGLAEAARRQVRTYSGGMRRRIDIAASLVATPEVLFLDEPTSGLDPRSRNQARAIDLIAKTLGNGVLPAAEAATVSARIAGAGQAAEILTALAHKGIGVAEFTLGSPTLDDVFFALTGHAAVEAEERA